jgi:hypothetical protein
MQIEQRSEVISVYLTVDAGWSKKIYLFSDVHFDSIYCRRDIYQKHLEQAKADGALILDGGDFFDAMQGRADPRRSMDDLRPEYRRDDYYDFVIQDAAKFLEKYAQHILLFAPGNHELSVLKNVNTHLTDRLVFTLRQIGSNVVSGGYKGWVRFLWKYEHGKNCGSVLLRYSHSGGGQSAPVTRGVIETNRQAVYLPDADIVWNGHNHHGWVVPIARERLSQKGKIYSDMAWFVRTPGYKAEYLQSTMGYEAQRASGPRPVGCVVLTLEYIDQVMKMKVEPLFEV